MRLAHSRQRQQLPAAALPEDLAAELRGYQRHGVDWLCALRDAGLGALLADDQLRAGFRVALTGTPVENRLDELWTQLHFTNRGLLGVALFGVEQRGAAGAGPPGDALRPSPVAPARWQAVFTDIADHGYAR